MLAYNLTADGYGVIQLDRKPGRFFDTVAQAMSGIVYAAEKKEITVAVDCPEDL